LSNDRWAQIGASGGIVFVLLLVAVLIFGPSLDTPSFSDGAGAVNSYVADNNNELQAAGALSFAAGYAFLFFLGSVVLAVRAAEGAPGRLAAVTAAGGIAFIALAGVGVGAHTAAALLQRDGGGTPETVTALWDAGNIAFVFMGFGLAAFLVAVAGAAVRFGALPEPLGILAGVLGVFVYVVSLFGTFAEDGAFSVRDGLLGQIELFVLLGVVGLLSLALINKPYYKLKRR
jgi:hypothetical protein